MIFPSGGQPLEAIFANHPLGPPALEAIVVIGAGPVGQRHQHRSTVEQLEHRRDRRAVEVADQSNNVARVYLAEVGSCLCSGDIVKGEATARTDQEWLMVAFVSLTQFL